MTDNSIRDSIKASILKRLDDSPSRRHEALQEFMGVTLPTVDDGSAASIASLVPQLPNSLYEKWATLFADRLLETVPKPQLEELCNGSADSEATLALVYVMFMESERMEKQIAEDLHALGVGTSAADAVGNALGSYLRARIASQKKAPAQ